VASGGEQVQNDANQIDGMPDSDKNPKWSWSTFWAVILAAFLLGVTVRLVTGGGMLIWHAPHTQIGYSR
jgi:hypothetical protein